MDNQTTNIYIAAAHDEEGPVDGNDYPGNSCRPTAYRSREATAAAHDHIDLAMAALTGARRSVELLNTIHDLEATLDDQAQRLAEARNTAERLRRERNTVVQALVHTVEYVGLQTLAPIPGWSWYDALVQTAPEAAQAFRAQWEAEGASVRAPWRPVQTEPAPDFQSTPGGPRPSRRERREAPVDVTDNVSR